MVNMNNILDFGKFLQNRRESKNLTKKYVAKEIGVTIDKIEEWENSKSFPLKQYWHLIFEMYDLENEDTDIEDLWDFFKLFQSLYTKKIDNLKYCNKNRNIEIEDFKKRNIPCFLFIPKEIDFIKDLKITNEEYEYIGLEKIYNGTFPYEYVKEKGSFYLLNLKENIDKKLGYLKNDVVDFLIRTQKSKIETDSETLAFDTIFWWKVCQKLDKDFFGQTRVCYIFRLYEIIEEILNFISTQENNNNKNKNVSIDMFCLNDNFEIVNEKIWNSFNVLFEKFPFWMFERFFDLSITSELNQNHTKTILKGKLILNEELFLFYDWYKENKEIIKNL